MGPRPSSPERSPADLNVPSRILRLFNGIFQMDPRGYPISRDCGIFPAILGDLTIVIL